MKATIELNLPFNLAIGFADLLVQGPQADFVFTQSIVPANFSWMPLGGKRPGAGRPRGSAVKKMYKLQPETIEQVKTIALGFGCTESAIAEQALRWYVPTKLEQARRRIAKNTQ